MVEAQATARGTSAPRPRRPGWCCDLIRGKNVNQALATLQFTRKTIARDMAKVLRSAVANAQQKDGFGGDVERLFVSACYANQGPSQKRVRPAPMGRAFRVVKRTAHLTVQVSERPQKIGAGGGRHGGDDAAARSARRQEESAAAKRARSKRGDNSGSESSPVRVPARLQQDLAVALVRRPRLREAAARGSGAAAGPQEAVRARRRRRGSRSSAPPTS